jgi:hypothetical protein
VWLSFEDTESNSGRRYFQKQGSDVTTWEIPGWTDPTLNANIVEHTVVANVEHTAVADFAENSSNTQDKDGALETVKPRADSHASGRASVIKPTALPKISNPFILREQMCSAVIAGAAAGEFN